MPGWLVSQAAKVAGPRVLIGVVTVGLAVIIALSATLYWTVQAKGRVTASLKVAKAAAENNALEVERLQADIHRRDALDAAYAEALRRIEGRFDGLHEQIRLEVERGASEAYRACRDVTAPAGLLDRLRDGARGQAGQSGSARAIPGPVSGP